MDEDLKKAFIEGYTEDTQFRTIYEETQVAPDSRSEGNKFLLGEDGLLYFLKADYQPRLCVPRKLRWEILEEAHESPLETAHLQTGQLWFKLSSKFYWKHMKIDIEEFCKTCDACQKTKTPNFNKYGLLIPSPIPTWPYESISMDLIVDLPWSDNFNAIFVVVDQLSKHAQFVPTTTGLDAEAFGALFIKEVVSRFGLPSSIISERDPRWTSDFWRSIVKHLKTKLALFSSHHLQHDGQTEIVNRTLESMLRSYVSEDRTSWAEWLHLLEFSYNSHVHSSTGTSPFKLLLGFQPSLPLTRLSPTIDQELANYSLSPEVANFLKDILVHRDSARLAIAKAQETQAKYYNKGRKKAPEFEPGSLVLVNPHSLEWKESKGKGVKLIQRWLGPFEVLERINPKVYRLRLSGKYPGFPVFNIKHLKAYRSSPPKWPNRTKLPETRTGDQEEEYEVDSIVVHRKRGGRLEYLVRWKGYGPQFDTWATHTDLKNAPEILRMYKLNNKL